jgi:hypothetical protein
MQLGQDVGQWLAFVSTAISRRGISLPADRLSASQGGLCYTQFSWGSQSYIIADLRKMCDGYEENYKNIKITDIHSQEKVR